MASGLPEGDRRPIRLPRGSRDRTGGAQAAVDYGRLADVLETRDLRVVTGEVAIAR